MEAWLKPIKRLSACKEAIEWGEQYGTIDEAWTNCERGDWMLWLVGKLAGKPASKSRKRLVLTACECARLALPYVRQGEKRPLKAIEAAEQWARGEHNITLSDVGAYAAADAASACAAGAADAACACAACAASACAADAASACAACAACAAGAACAADADARKKTLKRCGDIVRKHYPKPPIRSK